MDFHFSKLVAGSNTIPDCKERANCFICSETLDHDGVHMSIEHTAYSKTGLPSKISQIMGEGFVVVFTAEDKICLRCSTMLNHCDKLESDLGVVQKALMGYLNKKFHISELTDNLSTDLENDEDRNPAITRCIQLPNLNEVCSRTDVSETKSSSSVTVPSKYKPLYNCDSCSFSTSHNSAFVSHEKKCQKLNFSCSMCGKKLENPKQVRRHIMEVHLSNWPCHFCGVVFSDQTDYTSHMKIHLSSKLYDPPAPKLELGVLRNNQGDYNCNICPFNTKDKTNFHEHIRSHIAKVFKCKKCKMKFLSKDDLNSHSETHKMMKCDFCPVTFQKRSNLDKHLKTHVIALTNGTKLDLFWENTNNSTQEKETMDSLNMNDFKCSICSVRFRDETMFLEHLETHNENIISIDRTNSVEQDIPTGSDYDNEDDLEDMFNRIHSDNDMASSVCIIETNGNDINLTSSDDHNKQGKLLANDDCHSSQMPKSVEEIDHSLDAPVMENESRISINMEEMILLRKQSSLDFGNDQDMDLLGMCEAQLSPDGNSREEVPVDTALIDNWPEPTKIKTYVCAICGYQTCDLVDLKSHFKEHKDNKSYICNICNRQLSSNQKLNNHLKSHQRFPGALICPYCNEEFSDRFHLTQHIQESHQSERILHKCQYCEERFPSKKLLKTHEETHPERYSVRCTACNQVFLKEKQLKDHMELEHRDPHCRFCGKEILKSKTLKNHELRHIRDKESYDCTSCTRKFKTKTGLRHHAAVHTGVYTYRCNFCNRGFMSRMMMEEHKSKHTREERYICDICGKKFNFQSTYWIHRKWHDNPYPYKCNYCNRMFRHSSLLAVHKRKHTGDRPYKCPHCPLAFPVGGTLKRHLIIHTGIYPFNCEECNRGFTTKHKYVTHRIKVHEDHQLVEAKKTPDEFRMVIREPPNDNEQQAELQLMAWDGEEEAEHGFIFEMENGESVLNSEIIPCTVITDNVLVDDMGNAQMIQIVLDDTSQPIGMISADDISKMQDDNVSMLTDLWSYQ